MGNFCTKCGADNTPDAKFCVKCGATLSGSQPQLQSQMVRPNATEKKPFYKTDTFCILLAIIIPIIGIPYLWIVSGMKAKTKVFCTIAAIVIAFIFVGIGGKNKDKADTSKPTTQTETQIKDVKSVANEYVEKFNAIAKAGNDNSSAIIKNVTYRDKGFDSFSGDHQKVKVQGVIDNGQIKSLMVYSTELIPQEGTTVLYWINSGAIAMQAYDKDMTNEEAIGIIKKLTHFNTGDKPSESEIEERTSVRGIKYEVHINNDEGFCLFIEPDNNSSSNGVKKESVLHKLTK